MAQLKPELKTILDRYGIDPRDKSQIWDCHGTLVLYHKAYEIIAAKENIRFDPPVILEGSSEKKTVAMLVVGHMGDRSDWSIGEAAPGNNKNAYPYAMSEKRARDRVIAKLVGLAAYVYSEDEADDFKDARPIANGHDPESEPPPAEPYTPPVIEVGVGDKGAPDWFSWASAIDREAQRLDRLTDLTALWKANGAALKNAEKNAPDWHANLLRSFSERKDIIRSGHP